MHYGYKRVKVEILNVNRNTYIISTIDFHCWILHNSEFIINSMKVIYMDKNIDAYIRRLIELDSRAVELKRKRDAELTELETRSKNELKGLDEELEEAAIRAKQRRDEAIEAGRLQAKEMEEAVNLKIDKLQAHFENFKEDAAMDIWKQLLAIER